MIKTKVNIKQLNKILNNSVSYSHGFLEGTEISQVLFNEKLGLFIESALKKYIDSKARLNPEQLHHVYEWNKVGSPNDRLFDFSVKASKTLINITGKFLKSYSIPENGTEPFVNKATIMENRIAVTVSPKNVNFLVFEDDGETIFTPNSVYIANPGGDKVAESFGKTFEEFFNVYLTSGLLTSSGLLSKLSNPKEFADWFPEGTRQGRFAGIKAGKKYMDIPNGLIIQ